MQVEIHNDGPVTLLVDSRRILEVTMTRVEGPLRIEDLEMVFFHQTHILLG